MFPKTHPTFFLQWAFGIPLCRVCFVTISAKKVWCKGYYVTLKLLFSYYLILLEHRPWEKPVSSEKYNSSEAAILWRSPHQWMWRDCMKVPWVYMKRETCLVVSACSSLNCFLSSHKWRHPHKEPGTRTIHPSSFLIMTYKSREW